MGKDLGVREGLVFDQWPFRLDIAYEYQCWIILGACFVSLLVCFLPCLCGMYRNPIAKGFTQWVYGRLHTFFCVALYGNLLFLSFTVSILPDITMNEVAYNASEALSWLLVHTIKFLYSTMLLIGLYLLYVLRERIAVAAGVEHMQFFQWGNLNPFYITKTRPIELFLWRCDELPSGPNPLKPNDVFVEVYLSFNEPARSRVHNNAGMQCTLKESFQMNLDERSQDDKLTIFAKSQGLVSSTTLAKTQLSIRELLEIEEKTGKHMADFTYEDVNFVKVALQPRGNVYIRIQPLNENELYVESNDFEVDEESIAALIC